MKITLGYIISFDYGICSCDSTKQKVIAWSIVEVEYAAAIKATS